MQKGFTLVEIMIAVAIVAILAAIAYPSYQQYVVRTKRGDMQSEMMRIAQEAQRYYIVNKKYNGMTLANLGATGSFPRDNTPLYNLNLTTTPKDASNPQSPHIAWTLTATPITGTTQAGNGVVCLNSQGHKLWVKGGGDCTGLSGTSTWTE